jgi:hypothetical protein
MNSSMATARIGQRLKPFKGRLALDAGEAEAWIAKDVAKFKRALSSLK